MGAWSPEEAARRCGGSATEASGDRREGVAGDRLRGESIASIAPQTGVSTVVVRGFLQAAASDASAGALDGEVGSAESTAAASATSGESTLGGGVRTGSVPKAS